MSHTVVTIGSFHHAGLACGGSETPAASRAWGLYAQPTALENVTNNADVLVYNEHLEDCCNVSNAKPVSHQIWAEDGLPDVDQLGAFTTTP